MLIESNINIPKIHNAGGQYQKYPWHEMKIGDSFLITSYSYKLQNCMSTIGNAWCSRHNPELKILTRKEGDGLRIFMVKR